MTPNPALNPDAQKATLFGSPPRYALRRRLAPRWASGMRTLPVFCVVAGVALAGCSKYLEVRVFNGGTAPIQVCSVSTGTDCVDIETNYSSAVLSWKQGQFRVASRGCQALYFVPGVANVDDYREERNAPINAVITDAGELLLVPKGQKPEAVTHSWQPAGFPLRPSDRACK